MEKNDSVCRETERWRNGKPAITTTHHELPRQQRHQRKRCRIRPLNDWDSCLATPQWARIRLSLPLSTNHGLHDERLQLQIQTGKTLCWRMCFGTDANQEIPARQHRFIGPKPLTNAPLGPVSIHCTLPKLLGNRHSQARVIPVIGICQHLNALAAQQTTRTQ